MLLPQSGMAHSYLDGLSGIEIGGSAHNPFGLKTWNVDFSAGTDTIFKQNEVKLAGESLHVDVVAPGDVLPFADGSLDFVLSSHVMEHFFDPIKALKEWRRVVRPGGFIFGIVPHKERTFDLERPRTPLQELIDRHSGAISPPEVDLHRHYSVWITEDLLELCQYLEFRVVDFLDKDDKVGNGFTVVMQKEADWLASRGVLNFRYALADALQHYQAGNIGAAELTYRQIVRLDPFHGDALHMLGVIACGKGEYAAGLELLGRAVAAQPDSAAYHFNFGKANQVLRRFEVASAEYRRALELSPNLIDAHCYLGAVEAQLGNTSAAALSYERALMLLKPEFAGTVTELRRQVIEAALA